MNEAQCVADYILYMLKEEMEHHPDVELTFTKMDYQGGDIGLKVSFGLKTEDL